MRHPFLTPTVAMIVGLSAGSVFAQGPPTQAVVVAPTPQLAYQGRLLEAGVAANGARAFVFSLKDPTGLELWSSGTQTVTVADGMYSVVLGSTGMPAIAATLLAQSELKLHVVIGGAAMSPDVDLIPAFQSRSAWELVGTFSGDLTGSQTQTVLTQIQGIPVDLTTTRPTTGQGLIYNGTKFVPSTVLGPKGDTGATGATGATGLQGLAGSTGATGLQGLMGITGATGLTGATGASGLDGKTVLNGIIAPVVSVGVNGDFYLNTVSSILYGPKADGAWPAGVSLVGVAGANGADGAPGVPGAAGTNGTNGAAGTNGTNGTNGANGAPGATGASPFTVSGTSAVYMAGKVGIGSASPTALLDVGGEALIHGLTLGYGPATNYTNTVFGMSALANISTGAYNVALGWEALKANLVGQWNLSLGSSSLTAALGDGNTGVGYGTGQRLTTGSKNTLIGYQAGNLLTTESNNIAIGNQGTPGDSGAIRIGAAGLQTSAYIAGIKDKTLTGTTKTVVIDTTTGQLGSVTSSGGSGSGTVTSVSVTSANGFGGSVATATATPAITLSTSVTGLLKGNGAGVSAASAGTDYQAPLSFSSPLSNASNTVSLGTVGVANGGTGSATQNFVDLTTTQTIAGSKTFSGGLNVSADSTYKLGGADLLHSKGGGTNLFLGVGTGAASNMSLYNTAIGNGAGSAFTGAWANTFVGYSSGASATGTGNSFFGKDAGLGNTTGDFNTAVGYQAGKNLVAGSNNIDLGNAGLSGDSGIIRIGSSNQTATYIAGIAGVTPSGTTQTVIINSNGQLGSVASSGNSGTVTSVGLSAPSFLSVSGSPVTTSGTLALSYSGSALPVANGGTGLTSVGSSGQVLSSNGSGMAWASPSSGPWTTSGSNISYSSGRVGIGTGSDTPAFSLDVKGNANVSAMATAQALSDDPSPSLLLRVFNRDNGWNYTTSLYNQVGIGFGYQDSTTGNQTMKSAIVSGTYGLNYLRFHVGDMTAARMFINSDGRVGIGKTNPGSILDVAGTVTATAFAGPLTGNATNVTGTVAAANGGTGATTLTGYVYGNATGTMTAATTIPGSAISGYLPVAHGGTGTTTGPTQGGVIYAVSDVVYGSTGAGTSGQVLLSRGTSNPVWSSNISGNAANVTGTVAVANGGTGLTTYATGDLLYASAANTLSKLTTGTNGYVLTLASGVPTWSAGPAGSITSDDHYNTKVGTSVLSGNSGSDNSAMGNMALQGNTTGSDNSAMGFDALYLNTTGGGNTAMGSQALMHNTSGNSNTALGHNAGNNWTTGDQNIAIGNSGVAGESNTLRIGNSAQIFRAYIAGISGKAYGTGSQVFISSDGLLGTTTSSRRFKENIQDMAQASSRIFNLRPVTFNYKAEYGGGGTQYGLIAEEVDQVIPEMTIRDKDGQIQTVAYQLLPPMLLNEAQKQHKAIEALQAENQTLKAEVETLKAQVAAILARLPK